MFQWLLCQGCQLLCDWTVLFPSNRLLRAFLATWFTWTPKLVGNRYSCWMLHTFFIITDSWYNSFLIFEGHLHIQIEKLHCQRKPGLKHPAEHNTFNRSPATLQESWDTLCKYALTQCSYSQAKTNHIILIQQQTEAKSQFTAQHERIINKTE